MGHFLLPPFSQELDSLGASMDEPIVIFSLAVLGVKKVIKH